MSKRKVRRARYRAEGRVLVMVCPYGTLHHRELDRVRHEQQPVEVIQGKGASLCAAVEKLGCRVGKIRYRLLNDRVSRYIRVEEWWILEDDYRAAKVLAEIVEEPPIEMFVGYNREVGRAFNEASLRAVAAQMAQQRMQVDRLIINSPTLEDIKKSMGEK